MAYLSLDGLDFHAYLLAADDQEGLAVFTGLTACVPEVTNEFTALLIVEADTAYATDDRVGAMSSHDLLRTTQSQTEVVILVVRLVMQRFHLCHDYCPMLMVMP